MFDVGASELLVIVIVAIIVIGPKDMPMALRAAGRWIGKIRRMSNHFRAGLDTMIREAEMEDMEKQWADRNKEIMAKYPNGGEEAGGGAPASLLPDDLPPPLPSENQPDPAAGASAEAAVTRAAPKKAAKRPAKKAESEPGLPLEPPPPPAKGA